MKRKVYLSVPMTLNWSSVQLFKKRFPEREFQVTLWDRNQFFPEYFKEAKEVVFFLPDWEFSSHIEDLPVGVKRELKEAVREGKKIYLGYITKSGDYNIYEAEIISGTIISGKKGTANMIFDSTEADSSNFIPKSVIYETDGYKASHRDTFSYAKKVSLVDCSGSLFEDVDQDERLLLML
jgi:hypothetical protein